MPIHVNHGDVGMYDMFLHKQDRAYTVPEIYEFVEKAGLNFVEFNSAHSRVMLNINSYIKNPELLKRLKKMDKVKQQAICEIMSGAIIKHSFYASKKKKPVAKLTDLDNIPYIYTISNVPKQISDYLQVNQNLIGGQMQFSWKSDLLGDVTLNIPVSQYTEHLFRNMIGDKKSFRELFKAVEKDMGKKIKDGDLAAEVNRVFPALEEAGALLLRNKKVDIPPMMQTK